MAWMFLLFFGAVFAVALICKLLEFLLKFVDDHFRKGQKDKDKRE